MERTKLLSPTPVRIVLDTDVIFQHRFLKGPGVELLAKFTVLTKSRLVVPRIVLQEAIKKYREELQEKTKRAVAAIDKLNGLLSPASGAVQPSVPFEQAAATYESALKSRLAELKASQPDYSDFPLEAIADRALRESRPFLREDKGFRDVVLWETVLRCVADASEQTVLITNDGGFAEEDQLHSDLKRDLTERGLHDEAVVLVRTLEECNEVYAKPFLRSASAIAEELRAGTYGRFNPSQFIASIGGDLFKEAEGYASEIADGSGCTSSMEEPFSMTDLELDSEVSIGDLYQLQASTLVIEASVGGRAMIDGMLFKAEFYIADDEDIEVLDSDWNDHYMWVQKWVPVTLTIYIEFDIESNEVVTWELESVTG